MGNEEGGKKTTRMSLDLSPNDKKILERLAQRRGTTQATVLRKAIALLGIVRDAEGRGETLVLLDSEGSVTSKLIGIE